VFGAKPPLARSPMGSPVAGPVAGRSPLERMPKEVKNVIGSHLDKKSLANLKRTSSTMARTVNPLPAARAATTVKTTAQAVVQDNTQIRREWKAMIADQRNTAATHPAPAVRFQNARQALEDQAEDRKFVGELKQDSKALRGVIKKADVQQKKNI